MKCRDCLYISLVYVLVITYLYIHICVVSPQVWSIASLHSLDHCDNDSREFLTKVRPKFGISAVRVVYALRFI